VVGNSLEIQLGQFYPLEVHLIVIEIALQVKRAIVSIKVKVVLVDERLLRSSCDIKGTPSNFS